jgi:hypothetical protein
MHQLIEQISYRVNSSPGFVDQLGRKNLANPGFYFDYVIDDKGRLVHVF